LQPTALFIGRRKPTRSTRQKPIALFIGRFQPFHKGHLFALGYISARSSRVLVAIGSAQEKGTKANPYSAKERMAMARAALCGAKLSRKCRLYLIPDIPSDRAWVAHVGARVPDYDVCYSNNARVLSLMRAAGKKVRRVPMLLRRRYNATSVRERMREGKEWKSRVPENVLGELERMGAGRRVRRA
jgi:nicotinamide-nucleotide adenylyltransferase